MRTTESQAQRASRTAEGDTDFPEVASGQSVIWQRALVRTLVHRRVPLSARRKLDRAILLRPEGCRTLDAIEAKFRLTNKYGVSRTSLRTYARKLERVAEPIFAGNLAAAIMGCMPATYRTDVAAGSQIILVSRLVQALTKKRPESGLEVADLVRLASALRSATSTLNAVKTGGTRGCGHNSDGREKMGKTSLCAASLPTLTEVLRTAYGLELPVGQPSETEAPASA